MHGFLSYLVKVQLEGGTYRIYGYGGKQVRDNLHSYDVACAVEAIYNKPQAGEVFNLGGGRDNSCSILEAFALVQELTGKKMRYEYCETARQGDHICYISDLRKIQRFLSPVDDHAVAGADVEGNRAGMARPPVRVKRYRSLRCHRCRTADCTDGPDIVLKGAGSP